MNIGTGSLGLQNLLQKAPAANGASPNRPEASPLSQAASGMTDRFQAKLQGSKAQGPKAYKSDLEEPNNERPYDFSDVLKQKAQPEDRPVYSGKPNGSPAVANVESNGDEAAEMQNLSTEDAHLSTPATLNDLNAGIQSKLPKAPFDLNAVQPADNDDGPLPAVVDRQAMMKFLVSMKAELGVAPKDIVRAFGKLSPNDLLKSPEETMAQVLGGLDLNAQERARAAVLYQNMLKETAEDSLAGWAQKTGSDVNMKVTTPEELKQQKLLSSLEHMNNQFFAKKNQGQEISVNGLDQNRGDDKNMALPASFDADATPLKTQQDNHGKDEFKMPMFFPANARTGGAANVTPPTPMSAQVAAQMAAVTNQAQTQNAAPQDDDTATDDVPTPQIANIKSFGPAGSSSLEPVGLVRTQKTADAAQMNVDGVQAAGDAQVMAMSSRKDSGSDKDEAQGDADSTPGFQPAQANGQVKNNQETFQAAASLNHVATAPKTSDDASNIRGVLQGAQLLIQKGGGEMKVQLHPEGMGTVDLRVAVNKGHIDIQMLTQSADTKRLLESGLADLKDSLIGHKLNIDTVKVDVANNKNFSNLDQQLAHQQREMAREFLGQFRDQNQANRQPFLDTNGMKNYARRSQVMKPSDVPSSSRAKESSRRLDLVA